MAAVCGIAGYFAPDGLAPDEGRAMLERMVAALDHRGPDDRGTFVSERCGLGATRLAIVDVAGGHMPIAVSGGQVVAVMNGEIYDHAETRAALEGTGRTFATRCDTEVVPHLYDVHGPDGVAPRLSGMFAFAVYDAREQRLLLGRDRFGMKPLYVTRAGGVWLFSSELKAILASGRADRRLDRRALLDVMTAGYPMPPRTMVEGVEALPPATTRLFERARVHPPRTYWRMPYPRADETALAARPSHGEAVEALRETMDRVIGQHLLADVEVGSYLSGGLDSVSVAARASALLERPLRTYAMVFPGPELRFDESPHSRQAAQAMGSIHREVPLHGLEERDYVGTIRAMEAPQIHTVAFCLYALARAVREDGLKVVLSGEGADEVFAGYGVFRLGKLRRSVLGRHLALRRAAVRLLLARRQPELVRSLGAWWGDEASLSARYGALPPWIEQWWLLAQAALPLVGEDARADLMPAPPLEPAEVSALASPLHRELALEQRTRLDGWVLHLGDRVSMAHGLEVRVPFLDHRLAEHAARVPDRWLLRGLREKQLLRDAMRGRIPDALRARKKRAFVAPVSSWLFGASRPAFVDDGLSDAVNRGLIRGGVVDGLRARLDRGVRDFAHLQSAWALNLALGTQVLVRELGLSVG